MSRPNQFSLLRQRRFAPFFATQFLGALNDNIFRNGLVILITFQGVLVAGMGHSQLANVAAGLFILPYFLFSATAGQLADKYEKSMLIRRIKLLEIGLMGFACTALITQSYTLLLLVLFLMGLQSTLFGPVKYAYLPQQLADHELVGGNALVESGTYVAIILGLIAGGIAVGDEITAFFLVNKQTILGVCLVTVAVIGYLISRRIPTTPASDPELAINWNAWKQTWQIVQFAREERSVFLSILGISWFWFFGSAMTIQIPAYTLDILNGNEAVTTFLLAAFAVDLGPHGFVAGLQVADAGTVLAEVGESLLDDLVGTAIVTVFGGDAAALLYGADDEVGIAGLFGNGTSSSPSSAAMRPASRPSSGIAICGPSRPKARPAC